MRLTTVTLALLLAASAALSSERSSAAPAPDGAAEAKRKLEALKKKMPEALTTWHRKPNLSGAADKDWEIRDWPIKVCRMTSPTKAKITFHGVNEHLGRADITLYLRYFDGLWTTTRCEGGGNEDFKVSLMLAIDQAAEKK